MTSGSLWNYYRGETDDVDDNPSDDKSFNYKTKIVGNAPENPENQIQIKMEISHHNYQYQI